MTDSMTAALSPAQTPSDAAPPLLSRSAGFGLLLLLPMLSLLVYFLFAGSVDLEWLHAQSDFRYMDPATTQELAARLAANDVWWQLGKFGLWPAVLLVLEALAIGVCCMGLGQLFGSDLTLRQLFLLGIWSKATYLLTAIASLLNMLVRDAPLHLQEHAIDPLSWHSLIHPQGNGALQFFAGIQGPLSLLGIGIIAWGFRTLTGRSRFQSGVFGALPYALFLASQYYLFGVTLK